VKIDIDGAVLQHTLAVRASADLLARLGKLTDFVFGIRPEHRRGAK
jgi:hypothetical protein